MQERRRWARTGLRNDSRVLDRDYAAVAGMIMGEVPGFAVAVRALAEFEQRVNDLMR